MLGQYVFAGMKQERLLFIVLIQHALFHVTTCPVLNSQECQRTGCALCATKVHHLTTLSVRFASCENIVSRFETSSLPTTPSPGAHQMSKHPRRPSGSQSGREKRREQSFHVRAKEPLGTDSHRTISKTSSGCRLLIGHKHALYYCAQSSNSFS